MPLTKIAVIIGAGPAGLTVAYELLTRTDIKPIILEKSRYIGGICRTVEHNGNKIDIGGHRFFSKSDRVMKWWLNILPLDPCVPQDVVISYQNKQAVVHHASAPGDPEKKMLVRKRVSHIYYLRKFFDYPVTASISTLRKLGTGITTGIIQSYVKALLFPIKNEKNLEDFFINRFGRKLYQTFFKDYTEKIWGVPCSQISPEWGAQRIKKLNVLRALLHAVRQPKADVAQKNVDTSLIEQFLYPKYGPGQLWQEVADKIIAMGGEIYMHADVKGISHSNGNITSVSAGVKNGNRKIFEGDYFFSTMPVKELTKAMWPAVPAHIASISDGLLYRDFITVGLLVDKLLLTNEKDPDRLIEDTWIYIQEKNTKIGRLQIFNNWSPHLVKDRDKVWLGLEYFCKKGDDIWKMNDDEMSAFAIKELAQIGAIDIQDVHDHVVVRDENTYPAYFGSYNRFNEIRDYMSGFENLFLIGRNGMHKYNNSDHSMLTAMVAVDNIIAGIKDKSNIWSINTEQEYHESKT